MHESAVRTNVFRRAFGYDMSTIRLVPLRVYFQRGQITRSGSIVEFDVARHSSDSLSNRDRECLLLKPQLNGSSKSSHLVYNVFGKRGSSFWGLGRRVLGIGLGAAQSAQGPHPT